MSNILKVDIATWIIVLILLIFIMSVDPFGFMSGILLASEIYTGLDIIKCVERYKNGIR